MDVITSVLLAILLLLVFAVYFQRHRSFQYFKERNLSTPPFNFFFGNLLTLWSKRALACQLQEWTKKYGKIYGIFSGCSPIFIVSDVNFLEQVFIKQFSHFASHNTDPYEHATKRSRQGLLMSSGETWRRQKQIVNPIITTSIPKLNPVFNQCIGEVLQSLQTLSLNRNNEIDVYPIYKKAFWDLMCRSFGVDTTLEKEETDELLYTFDRFFHRTENANYWALKACEMFPSFDTVFLRLNEIYNDIGRFISDLICSKPSKSLWEGFALYRLKDQMYDIFSKRWNDPNYSHHQNEERNDLLLMMSKFLQFQRTEDAGKVAETTPKQKQQRYIGPHEIVDNAFLMIGALYAGAPALMAFLCHTLATHPDVQQKLQDEIEQYLSLTESETLDGNTVSKMPYLDLVLREILRMYPIATQDVNRKCLKETTINGIHITKGAVVRVDVLSVHYDPDLWGPEDPNIFCPERHASRKRHPLSLLFFGAGPKCCPGIEFTEVTVKMMLVGLVRQFNIAPCESHNAGLHIKETVGHLPAEAWIKLISRL